MFISFGRHSKLLFESVYYSQLNNQRLYGQTRRRLNEAICIHFTSIHPICYQIRHHLSKGIHFQHWTMYYNLPFFSNLILSPYHKYECRNRFYYMYLSCNTFHYRNTISISRCRTVRVDIKHVHFEFLVTDKYIAEYITYHGKYLFSDTYSLVTSLNRKRRTQNIV